MKRYLTVWILAAVLGGSWSGPALAAKTVESPNEGRFILFNAEYNSAIIQRSQTTTFLEKRLFKIDRKTGETWMLIDAIREGKDIKFWKKIDNDKASE